jgi:hypothetical protein
VQVVADELLQLFPQIVLVAVFRSFDSYQSHLGCGVGGVVGTPTQPGRKTGWPTATAGHGGS